MLQVRKDRKALLVSQELLEPLDHKVQQDQLAHKDHLVLQE